MDATKPTLEQRVEALERVCFHNGAAAPMPLDIDGVSVAAECISAACDYYDIPRGCMRILRRTKKLAFVRQLAMSLSLELSGLSSQEVADMFNRQDHGTVLHAHRKIRKWAKARKNAAVMAFLRQKIRLACDSKP